MARIYLDARCVTDAPCGVGRYARGLIPALAVLAPEHEFIVIRHASNREPIANGPNIREVFVARTDDNFAHFVFGRHAIRSTFERHGRPDLYHALFHLLPLGFPGHSASRPRVIVTVHDLIWLDHPFRLSNRLVGVGIRLYAPFALPRSIRLADWVISVSQATTQRIEAIAGRGRVVTIHHGVAPEFFADPPPLAARWQHLADAQAPFVIAVANSKRYKNLLLLIKAFAEATRDGLRARLVLVGDCSALSGEIAALGITEKTVLTGFVSDGDLRALVGRATLFVQPSLAEGFGLPVLEAMALGTPAAVSDIAPLREIAGDAAVQFDPHDVSALAEILRRLSADVDLRGDLSARGRRRASDFQWSSTARKTLDVYQRALGSAAGARESGGPGL